jgi:hypothetical protein
MIAAAARTQARMQALDVMVDELVPWLNQYIDGLWHLYREDPPAAAFH